MAKLDTAYFVFDIESVADGALVSRLKYPGENLAPAEAIAKYREELLKENGKDFIPYTYQLPVSLVIAKVARDFSLLDLVALDEKEARPHEIVKNFWQGWQKYSRPTLVTFNGRGFDLPLLIPAHCTGWRAVNALEREFGERVVPAAVGKLFTLEAA